MLRRFRAADAGTLAAYRSNPDVARYQSWTAPFPLERARGLVAQFEAANPESPGWFQWAIEHVADRVHIGDVGVSLHENKMQAEIGFTLAPAYQKRGYAAEAVRGMLDHLFRGRGLHKVSAEADARNIASARLLERVGFVREGLLRSQTWIKGEWTDDLIYGLLADEWLTR